MLLVIPNQIRFLQKFSYQLRSVIKKKKKKKIGLLKKREKPKVAQFVRKNMLERVTEDYFSLLPTRRSKHHNSTMSSYGLFACCEIPKIKDLEK